MTKSRIKLQPMLQGTGEIEEDPQNPIKLILPEQHKGYSNAQLDDYASLPRKQFKWRPPLRFEIEARASHSSPTGTLGFGFWNDPFTFSLGEGARRVPSAPQTLWFFYASPETNIHLVREVPGNGWKAASLRTPNLHPLILAPLAGSAIVMSKLPVLRRFIHRIGMNIAKSTERLLPQPLNEWHSYAIEWRDQAALFFVDEELVLETEYPPTGPLGFVTWIDNQYAVFSSDQSLRFGTVPTSSKQHLELRSMAIDPLTQSP